MSLKYKRVALADDVPVSVKSTTSPFEITDKDGNVILRITSTGAIVTKTFDSDNITASGSSVSVGDAQIIIKQGGVEKGRFTTNQSGSDVLIELDETATSSEDFVVQIGDNEYTLEDGKIVLSNVALLSDIPISSEDSTYPLEISDEQGNVALRISSTGGIETAGFYSDEKTKYIGISYDVDDGFYLYNLNIEQTDEGDFTFSVDNRYTVGFSGNHVVSVDQEVFGSVFYSDGYDHTQMMVGFTPMYFDDDLLAHKAPAIQSEYANGFLSSFLANIQSVGLIYVVINYSKHTFSYVQLAQDGILNVTDV